MTTATTPSTADRRTRTRTYAAILAALLLAGGMAGCTRTEPKPSPTPTFTPSLPPRLVDRDRSTPGTSAPPPTVAAPAVGIRYQLPDSMCRVADLTPLQETFPKRDDKPLLDTRRVCDTAVMSPTMVVGITITAALLPDTNLAQQYHDTARRLARNSPMDIPNAGSAAFYTSGPNKVELVTYHGNLALHITCISVNDRQQLPADIPARLARVAASTYVRLR